VDCDTGSRIERRALMGYGNEYLPQIGLILDRQRKSLSEMEGKTVKAAYVNNESFSAQLILVFSDFTWIVIDAESTFDGETWVNVHEDIPALETLVKAGLVPLNRAEQQQVIWDERKRRAEEKRLAEGK
jgi:hypothetical protein